MDPAVGKCIRIFVLCLHLLKLYQVVFCLQTFKCQVMFFRGSHWPRFKHIVNVLSEHRLGIFCFSVVSLQLSGLCFHSDTLVVFKNLYVLGLPSKGAATHKTRFSNNVAMIKHLELTKCSTLMVRNILYRHSRYTYVKFVKAFKVRHSYAWTSRYDILLLGRQMSSGTTNYVTFLSLDIIRPLGPRTVCHSYAWTSDVK